MHAFILQETIVNWWRKSELINNEKIQCPEIIRVGRYTKEINGDLNKTDKTILRYILSLSVNKIPLILIFA